MDGRPEILGSEGRRAANVRQAKRYGERWCAGRLYPSLPLREAVARLGDNTSIQLASPSLGLPPTREQQQQARRLAETGAKEVERIKVALEPRKPPAETKSLRGTHARRG
ncbi:MAG: hypothetical protein ACN6OP_15285 [Pseudomonadales bacterium]